jgi:magnesium and cobalt transporter
MPAVRSRTRVKELEARLDVKLLSAEQEEEIDTLGGLVFALVGHVPARGELVPHPSGIEFEVLEADPRRIKRLKVHRARKPGSKPPTGSTKTP